ncbi:MAG TPA: glycosyltransferase family 4 protein [Dermatophilaceae bacterium]|nr:glycosyltransferase family 4 protein [Dermatophilaceae bacterium]
MAQPRETRRPRVLLLNWRDTRHPEGGGSEVYAEHVADGLQGQGYDVTLLTARYAGSLATEVRDSGALVVRRGGRLGVYPHAALAVRLGGVPRPDVIVEVQNGMPYLAALWAPRTPHVVLVHHVHREQWPVVFGRLAARLGWFLESRVAPWVNRHRPYVVVSERTRSELQGLGIDPSRVSVIHNGALPPPPHDVRRSAQPQLLVLGRLVPHKRVEIALTTAERLQGEFPGLKLVIAGRGWWEGHLADEIDRRGLHHLVEVRGFVSEEDRHRLYASSWVSLVPSLKEGWGLVVVEAGLHETPSVAFQEAGGVAESIRDGRTGLLAREDDVEHFVALTRQLLADRGLREHLGRNAAEFAGYFTWEQTSKSFAALIDAVLQDG